MNVEGIERIKEVKSVEGALRKGGRLRGEVREVNLAKGEATLALSNGKELRVKIEGDIEKLIKGKNYSFEILDFKSGELKLGFSKGDLVKANSISSLESFMKDNKLPMKYKPFLEIMMKHDIALTKENLIKFSSFMEFGKRLSNGEGEVERVFNSYIEEKALQGGVSKTVDLKGLIAETLKEFKSFTPSDIAGFIENDIDFNLDNFKSFNNVFKNKEGIFNILKDLGSKVNLLEQKESLAQERKVFESENSFKKESFFNELINSDKESLSESNKGIIKENLKDSFQLNNKESLKGEAQLGNEETLKSETKLNDKIQLSNELQEINKDIFDDLESFNIKDENKNNNDNNNVLDREKSNKLIAGLEIGNSSEFAESKETIKLKVMEFIDKNNLSIAVDKGELNKAIENIKNNDIEKIFSEKEGKLILEKTITKALGGKFSFLEDDFKSLKEAIIKGNNNLVEDSKNNIDNREIIRAIKDKEQEMQSIIKKLIKEVSTNSNKSEAILNLIKNNINDFKLFNNISNEYYYLDLPININKEEYGCRLVIKDERGEGKEIDKNNAKLVLSVRTIKMGEVDAFLKFSNKTLNVELKSERENVEFLRENLRKLEKSLELLGFMPYIFVSEKVYEKSDINRYREFFGNNSNEVLNKLV